MNVLHTPPLRQTPPRSCHPCVLRLFGSELSSGHKPHGCGCTAWALVPALQPRWPGRLNRRSGHAVTIGDTGLAPGPGGGGGTGTISQYLIKMSNCCDFLWGFIYQTMEPLYCKWDLMCNIVGNRGETSQIPPSDVILTWKLGDKTRALWICCEENSDLNYFPFTRSSRVLFFFCLRLMSIKVELPTTT